ARALLKNPSILILDEGDYS
ncbi:unnamed protein product, partial [Rotaria magnacalcarata]